MLSVSLVLMFIVSGFMAQAQEELSPYYKVGDVAGSVDQAADQVSKALEKWEFEVLGSYNPKGSDQMLVIAYTRKDLQSVCLKVEDRGILASVLKIGLKQSEDRVEVSMLNPMYLFYAYLRDDTDAHKEDLKLIVGDAKQAMKELGSDFTEFGGSEEIEDLKKYHYMAFMPYFDEPVELQTFDSFDQGVAIIQKNLASKKGNTLKVFELILKDKQMAVFGVGLLDGEDGEEKFLPIIGEENLAAMPYEIVLVGKEATMLHGKFRFALHWPELSMGQFMKISSTPGDVEDFLEALTEE